MSMKLWNQVCRTDPLTTKRVNSRGGFTAIDAQSQLKRATALWGPYGSEWGMRDATIDFVKNADGAVESVVYLAEFYYPDGAFPIAADQPWQSRDDAVLKAATHARSKALSYLGFNSDVFEGKFDDNAYQAEMGAKFSDNKDFVNRVASAIRVAKDIDTLKKQWKRVDEVNANGTLEPEQYEMLSAIATERRESLEEATA